MTSIKHDLYYSGLLCAIRLRGPLVLCVALLEPALARLICGLREEREGGVAGRSRLPGVGRTLAFSKGFYGTLLVVHASHTAKNVAREAADSLVEACARLIGVVLNGRP